MVVPLRTTAHVVVPVPYRHRCRCRCRYRNRYLPVPAPVPVPVPIPVPIPVRRSPRTGTHSSPGRHASAEGRRAYTQIRTARSHVSGRSTAGRHTRGCTQRPALQRIGTTRLDSLAPLCALLSRSRPRPNGIGPPGTVARCRTSRLNSQCGEAMGESHSTLSSFPPEAILTSPLMMRLAQKNWRPQTNRFARDMKARAGTECAAPVA